MNRVPGWEWCVGWSSKQADRSAPNVNEDVDRANEHMQRGFAAVHAIRIHEDGLDGGADPGHDGVVISV